MATLSNIGEKQGGGPARSNASTVTELDAAATAFLPPIEVTRSSWSHTQIKQFT
jgi:hypothetical protein